MAEEAPKSFKYSIHLATAGVTKLEDFLTEKARGEAKTIALRAPLGFDCELRYTSVPATPPSWAKKLNEHFSVDEKIKTASSSAVILFRCGSRVLGCAYGHGHTLIDADKRENDFGLLVAANSLSDENVKLVEKANLGSVIRDATQAAGITRLQDFNVDRALSLVRRLSGKNKDGGSSLSGASSITMTSSKDIDELHEIAKILLKLYKSTEYRKTAFSIIDKIKPVFDITLIKDLDDKLLVELNSPAANFELGAPEIITETIGYMTLLGVKRRVNLPDISLSDVLSVVGKFNNLDDLFKIQIATYNIDGKYQIKQWSVYRGLVGSLAHNGARYALNEGRWYRIDKALADSAESTFKAISKGLDKSFVPWPIVCAGRVGKTPVYEVEDKFNKRVVSLDSKRYLLFDQNFVQIPGTPGPGLEICDLLDIKEKRLIHVKKSGRRSSVISHFLMQGMNASKLVRHYDKIRAGFRDKVAQKIGSTEADALLSDFPHAWTVEFKLGDRPISGTGAYTIPFFSRVTLDEVRREIEGLGFKAVELSFIRLSSPPA